MRRTLEWLRDILGCIILLPIIIWLAFWNALQLLFALFWPNPSKKDDKHG